MLLSSFTSGVSVLIAALHGRQGLGKLRQEEQEEGESLPVNTALRSPLCHLPQNTVEETESQILFSGRG